MTVDEFYKILSAQVKNAPLPKVIESGEGAYLTINGKKLLNFCSSHYLGLATDDRLKSSVKIAVEKYGMGTGYRTLAGTHVLHVQLEEALARFKQAEAAIILTGGYMANLAAIQTIIGKDDIVISDELNHASIIDAVKLSGVKNKLIYKHADVFDLEEKLKQAAVLREVPISDGKTPIILIVTDGVFSMDGDLAPLPQMVKLAQKYQALTMVDDAHGEGVMGRGGRGIVDHFNLQGQIDIEIGTLSKAFSVMGGYITGRRELIVFYKQKSRQFLFSNALTIADTAATLEGVKILEESDKLVKQLWDNASYLKKEFQKLGFDTGHSLSPITPVMLRDEELSVNFSAKLLESGVFATPIKFPMVARGKARIRVIPSAAHSRKDLDLGIAAFRQAANVLGILQ